MADYVLDLLRLQWIHPETGCAINIEDMPWELHPEGIE